MPKSSSELGTRLRETLDNLIDATRQVARPGWIWIVGFVYPSVVGAFEVVVDVRKKLEELNVQNEFEELKSWLESHLDSVDLGFLSFENLSLEATWENLTQGESVLIVGLASLIVVAAVLLLLLLVSRLTVGLAAYIQPDAWSGDPLQQPVRGSAWELGKGMTWSALGIRVLLRLMQIVAILLIGLPVLFLEDILPKESGGGLGFLLKIVYLPFAGILTVYFVVLSALHQLAIHSLVQNRRGMTSALRHAWRLFRVETKISVSYLIVEGSVSFVFSLVMWAITKVPNFTCCFCCINPYTLLGFSLMAFQGVLRAAFWARAYQHMGGATSSDTLGGIGASPSQT